VDWYPPRIPQLHLGTMVFGPVRLRACPWPSEKEGTMNKLQEIRFVEEPPRPRSGMSGQWMQQLDPLRSFPGRWALIYTCEHPNAANKLQSNLHGRKVLIPEPNHTWEFAARGCEVYAVYRGRKKGGEKAVRNSTNRR
jgi:hypothetical protein